MPQPSGWPDFGFGWGHPKSRKFLPVSASCRNAMSVSTGADFRLTIASIRHMSAQRVPDFPEEGDPLRPVFLGLEAFRPLAVDDSQDAATAAGRRDNDVNGIRCRGKHGHDFGDIAQGPQDVDRVGVLHEYDEEVSRSDREGVLRGELLQAVIVAFDPDERRPGRFTESNPEFDPGDGSDERLVNILGRLDEVGLSEDYVQAVRVVDGDEFRLDRHRQCIGPRELKSSSRKWRYTTCTRKGQGIGNRSMPHGGNPRLVDDLWQRRQSGGTGRPRARRDGDPSALREPRRSGAGCGGGHGDPVSVGGVADASAAWAGPGSRPGPPCPGPP